MGAYREQLLRETGGRSSRELDRQNQREDMSSGFLTAFKIRFTISLLLFGIFAWMSLTGTQVFHVSSEQVEEAVSSDVFRGQISDYLAKLGLYE